MFLSQVSGRIIGVPLYCINTMRQKDRRMIQWIHFIIWPSYRSVRKMQRGGRLPSCITGSLPTAEFLQKKSLSWFEYKLD